jgi:hypothetical protein
MVKRCINPECPNEFRHLNTGDLYALESGMADTKFLWLCAECSPKMAVAIDAAGEISVRKRTLPSTSGSWTVPASHVARLRLISGHRLSGAWPRVGNMARSDAYSDEPDTRQLSHQAA